MTSLKMLVTGAILGKVLGRKVRHVPTPMWMFFKAAGTIGTSPILMGGMRYYVEEHARGTSDEVVRAAGVWPAVLAVLRDRTRFTHSGVRS
jgi:hypothetical protein